MEKQKEIYGNFQVFGPDGKWMFATNKKKYDWYLKKNLAYLLEDGSIQLNFSPKGNGNIHIPFFVQAQKNICVACGVNHDLTKHHVVPICYRKHFPLSEKAHNMHDVLVLCLECHEKYERKADELKELLRLENNIIRANTDRKKTKIKTMAQTILNHGVVFNIPDEKQKKLKSTIAAYLGKDVCSYDDLLQLSQTCVLANPEAKSEGELVVKSQKNLKDFVQRWRNHFIENLEPKFLPEFWAVDFDKENYNY